MSLSLRLPRATSCVQRVTTSPGWPLRHLVAEVVVRTTSTTPAARALSVCRDSRVPRVTQLAGGLVINIISPLNYHDTVYFTSSNVWHIAAPNQGRKSCRLSVVSLVTSPVSPRKPGEAAIEALAGDERVEAASGGNGGRGDRTPPSLSSLILRLPPSASPAPASLPSSSSASAFNSGCRSISPATSSSVPLLFASCNRCLRVTAANGGVFGRGMGSGLVPGLTTAALQAAASASAAPPRFSSAESSLGARGQTEEARAASCGTHCHGGAFDHC